MLMNHEIETIEENALAELNGMQTIGHAFMEGVGNVKDKDLILFFAQLHIESRVYELVDDDLKPEKPFLAHEILRLLTINECLEKEREIIRDSER